MERERIEAEVIVAITENYHDYQPQTYFIETENLPDTFVGNEVKKAVAEGKKRLTIDCSRWEEEAHEKFGGVEPAMPPEAKVDHGGANTILVVNFQFE